MIVDRARFLLLASALAAASCAASTDDAESGTQDIINGEADTLHEAVVAIRWTITTPTMEGQGFCTGTLVGPRTILTAAHCVVPPKDDQTFHRHEVFFGRNPAQNPNGWFKVATTKAHPKYTLGGAFDTVRQNFDVALLTLEKESLLPPIKIATQIDGDLTGTTVTHVGFGVTFALGQLQLGSGERRNRVSLPITEQLEFLLKTGNGVQGICSGDSGGPALLRVGGEDVIVGIHSFTDDGNFCLNNGFSARTDVATDFIFSAELPATRFGQRVEGNRVPPTGTGFRTRQCEISSSDGIGNLRAQPTTASAIVRALRTGDKVLAKGKTGEWYKVESGGDAGFMHQSLLKKAPCGPTPTDVP